MAGSMTDKILCPWCGAKMRMKVYNDCAFTGGRMLGEAWRAFYRCHLCGAQGPEESRSDGNKAEEAARAAALRRYTPPAPRPSRPVPLKPMTLEESEYKSDLIYLEKKGEGELILGDMCGTAKDGLVCFVRDDPYDPIPGDNLDKDEYGKTWRYWETMPTDEERGAAGWETSRQE